jgi:hypothetical protein
MVMNNKNNNIIGLIIEILFWVLLATLIIVKVFLQKSNDIQEAVANEILSVILITGIFFFPVLFVIFVGELPLTYFMKNSKLKENNALTKELLNDVDSLIIYKSNLVQKLNRKIYTSGIFYLSLGVLLIFTGIILLCFSTQEIITKTSGVGAYEIIHLAQRVSIAFIAEVIGLYFVRLHKDLISKDYKAHKKNEFDFINQLIILLLTKDGKNIDDELKKAFLARQNDSLIEQKNESNTNEQDKDTLHLLTKVIESLTTKITS